MSRFYMIAAIAGLAFFAYAQHAGMSLTGTRSTQHLSSGGSAGSGSSWRSGSLSHK